MSRCQGEDFIAARALPSQSPLFLSPASGAVYIRARPGNPYKRYVTTTCRNNQTLTASRQSVTARMQSRDQRYTNLSSRLQQLDQQAQLALPGILTDLRNYRYNGVTIANVEQLCRRVENLDPQGQTCMYLWFTRPGNTKTKTGRMLRVPPSRNWNKFSAGRKSDVRTATRYAQMLADAPAVQINPVRSFDACPNLRVASHHSNFADQDPMTNAFSVFTPYVDMCKVTLTDAREFCVLTEGVVDACGSDPINIITNHGGNQAQARYPVLFTINFPASYFIGAQKSPVSIPQIRLFRIAQAYQQMPPPP